MPQTKFVYALARPQDSREYRDLLASEIVKVCEPYEKIDSLVDYLMGYLIANRHQPMRWKIYSDDDEAQEWVDVYLADLFELQFNDRRNSILQIIELRERILDDLQFP